MQKIQHSRDLSNGAGSYKGPESLKRVHKRKRFTFNFVCELPQGAAWSRQQDLNLRHLRPERSTLPN